MYSAEVLLCKNHWNELENTIHSMHKCPLEIPFNVKNQY